MLLKVVGLPTHTQKAPLQEKKNTICLHARLTQKAKSFPQEKQINSCLSSCDGSALSCYLIESDAGSLSFPWNLTSLHAVPSINNPAQVVE